MNPKTGHCDLTNPGVKMKPLLHNLIGFKNERAISKISKGRLTYTLLHLIMPYINARNQDQTPKYL